MTLRRQAAVLGASLALAGFSRAAFAVTDHEMFAANCVACHGPDLKGVQGLGVNLVASKFVAGKSVAQLVAFLKVGRQPGDPASVAGRSMPAFAWLAEADLTAIAAYVKGRNGRCGGCRPAGR
jgi:mono/diheme cytochrome c family protein